MKLCPRCEQFQPVEEFRKNRNRPDGLGAYCKTCSKAIEIVSYNKKRPQYLASRQRYYQDNKDKMRLANGRWRVENHDKVLVDHKQYYQDNREERMAYQRNYHREHPDVAVRAGALRRLRKTEQWVEDVSRQTVWIRDNGICGICEENADYNDWHLDHIIPLSRNGEHSYANVQVSHPLCNKRKHASIMKAGQ